ncbi:uncharacterized protein LOC143465453 isoform X3 [Clavelina lepadiformis]|uniref:uncharacterized protein LOC143465453 isoform X3 n=1 Tax=Clavelina lepadiformis TaxID=159417 RepID=UPI0040436FEA
MEEKQCSSKNFSQTTSRHHYQDLSSDTDSDIPSTSKFQRKSRRHRRHFSDSDSDLSSVSWERSRQHLRDISSDSDSYKSREHRKKSKCHHRHLRDIDSDLSSSSYTSQSEMKQHQGFFGESPGSRRREKSRHHRQVVSSDADSDKSRKQQRKSRYLHQGYSSDLTSDSSPKLFRKSRRQRQHFSSYSSGNRKRNKNVDTKASSSSVMSRNIKRSSTITGIKRKEVEDHEVMDSGFYSILVADQKEKTRHACLVLSPEEFEDVKKTSDHVWSFLQALPTLNDRVFPSLSGSNLKGRMSSAAFNTIYKKISRKCFKTPVNVTETRKLITREISGKPRQIKEAIARAEGHTLGVADTFYDVTHPSEIVQTARIYLEEIAMKTVSESGVKSNTGAVAGSQTQKAAEPVPNVTDKSDCQIGAVTGSQTQEAAEPVPNVTDKSDCQIGAVTGSQTQEAAEPVPNVTDKSDCQIGAVTGSQTQEPAEPVPNVTDKSDCQIGAVTGRQAQEESGPTIGVAISFSEANVIRVKFTYDRIILDIFRPADIRFASGGDVQSLADIKMGEKCLARWPPDKQFYLATRVDPSFCTPKKRREGTYYSDSDTSPQKKVQLPVTAKRRRKKITFTNFEYA